MIKNATQFITRWSSEMTPVSNDLEESQKSISKAIFKGTKCGAWFAWCMGNCFIWFKKPYGVQVGSIVEGLDSDVTEVVKFPFSWTDFWEALRKTEEAADDLWLQTHGCDHCWRDAPTDDLYPVNPDCLNCGGEGVPR